MIIPSLTIAILATAPAAGTTPATPHAIVQSLYAPYLADQNPDSAQDSLRPYASKSLRRLIDADDACMKREQGICNIDFDILIAGQDGAPAHLAITDGPAKARGQVVRARFDNGGAVEVRFVFVRQGGAWKIDDVEDLRPHDDPIRRDIHLKKQLRGTTR